MEFLKNWFKPEEPKPEVTAEDLAAMHRTLQGQFEDKKPKTKETPESKDIKRDSA